MSTARISRYPIAGAIALLVTLAACGGDRPTGVEAPASAPSAVPRGPEQPRDGARPVDARARLREVARATPGLFDRCGALSLVSTAGAALIGCPVRVPLAVAPTPRVTDAEQAELEQLRVEVEQGLQELAGSWGGRDTYLRQEQGAEESPSPWQATLSCSAELDRALVSTIETVSYAVQFGVAYANRDVYGARNAAAQFWPSLSRTVSSIGAFLRCSGSGGDKRVN